MARRFETGRVPTLRELRRSVSWMRLICRNCGKQRPVLLVHLMLAFGVDASSERVRSQVRCQECGHQGVDTYHPSWTDSAAGFEAFPGYGEQIADGPIETGSQFTMAS